MSGDLTLRYADLLPSYSIYYNIFVEKLTKYLPTYVAEFAIKAGLPLTEATAFVTDWLTAPTEAVKLPGITAEIIAAATKGEQWAYAEALHYVWLVTLSDGLAHGG